VKCIPSQVDDLSSFHPALHLFPTVQAVAEYNLMKLRNINRLVVTITAMHIPGV